MGKSVGSVAATLTGPVGGIVTGKGLFGGLQDAVLGKKDPGTADQVIDPASPQGRALQEQALGKYGEVLNQDTNQLAQAQIDLQENQARVGARDQEIKAQQMIAQRGLGNTSIGLNALMNPSKQLGNQIGQIRSQQPILQNQLKQQNLNFATGGINQILGEQGQSKIFKMGQASKGRQGGLAPLIGGGIGAALGGPAGAQAGMGMGQMATQLG